MDERLKGRTKEEPGWFEGGERNASPPHLYLELVYLSHRRHVQRR
jgi:hypothetical protein